MEAGEGRDGSRVGTVSPGHTFYLHPALLRDSVVTEEPQQSTFSLVKRGEKWGPQETPLPCPSTSSGDPGLASAVGSVFGASVNQIIFLRHENSHQFLLLLLGCIAQHVGS